MAASNHTNLHASNSDGHQLSLQHTSTDSPILPAENLRQLREIDPGLVDWVVDQTESEANHRRTQESRINIFILAERMGGLILGAIVAISGLAIGAYVILQGHDWAGVGICGTGLVSIVSIIVARQSKSDKKETDKSPQPRKKPPQKK